VRKQSVSMWLMLSMLLLPALPALAQEAAVAELSSSAAGLEWRPLAADYERAVLTVSGPNGNVIRREFESGKVPALSLFDAKGQRLADGSYQWEIRIAPRVPPALRAQLNAARAAGDDAAAKRLQRQLPAGPAVQSGSFQIHQGSIVSGGAAESRHDAGAAPAGPQSAAKPGLSNVTAADQVIPDDLIVQQSLCVGFDCVNNESFGFDTIRLKENSTRIKFEDTSVGSFPANDWQLTANDSASGGANKFSIEDITGSKVPFTITAGAATNSIFLDSTGRLGLRTSTPVLDVHISTSNTPAIRLEQTSAGGFTAQTWDVAGNEANFFVRDVTGGSRLPFRIRPGAPTSSVDISADGDVGIGTASPDEKLHVLESVDAVTVSLVQNTSATVNAVALTRAQSDTATVNFQAHASARTAVRWGAALGGWTELLSIAGNGLAVGTNTATPLIFGTNGTKRIEIGSAGGVTVTGAFTVTGGTKNFAMVDPADSRKAIYFAALEGPEAGTYIRGTAKTSNGEVVIQLPGYFTRATENERMTVQLTPVGGWSQVYVAEKSPERLVVRVAPGGSDLEFDYLVQGVRKGYLDYQVERVNDLD
jgi:hypothetical protein